GRPPKKSSDTVDDTVSEKPKRGRPPKKSNNASEEEKTRKNKYEDNIVKSNSIELIIKRKIEGEDSSDKCTTIDISNGTFIGTIFSFNFTLVPINVLLSIFLMVVDMKNLFRTLH